MTKLGYTEIVIFHSFRMISGVTDGRWVAEWRISTLTS